MIGILLVMVSSSVVALPFTTPTQEEGASLTGAMVRIEDCQYWRKFVNNYYITNTVYAGGYKEI